MLLGAHNIKKEKEAGRETASVASIKIHEDWNPSTTEFRGDLALLKLAQTVKVNDYVKPVPIANSQLSAITQGVVTGWGYYDDNDVPSDIPRKLEISILSDLACLKNNPGLLPIFTDDLFCAGKVGAGVCSGDSGSGFYIQSEDGKTYLRGIVSSSTRAKCSESKSALYSDILKNLDFLSKASTFTKHIFGKYQKYIDFLSNSQNSSKPDKGQISSEALRRHKNIRLLNSQSCGVNGVADRKDLRKKRIIGGQEAALREFPWM